MQLIDNIKAATTILLFITIITILALGSPARNKKPPSVWIDSWLNNGKERHGRYYNDCKKLNDHQYLFIGRDLKGNVFDSSIITVNE